MTKHVIVSGYFNPLHVGHLKMMEAASDLGDRLIVIVNNDVQQLIKKGKIITPEADRIRLVEALRIVDETILSVDIDSSVSKTLNNIRASYPSDNLIFANGGDRKNPHLIAENEICIACNIKMHFGAGGNDKHDSSSRINAALGVDDPS